MLTKTEVRKTVGRGAFTVSDFADALSVSGQAARARIKALAEAGVVERLPETQPVLTDDGEPSRGRPRHLFRVASGK